MRRALLACAAVGAVLAFGLDLRDGPVFESSSQLFLTAAPNAPQVDAATLQQKAASYARLAVGQEVTSGVAKDVTLPYAADLLDDHITVTVEPGTALLDVRVRDASPGLARDIADAVATHLVEAVKTLEAPMGAGSPSVVLQVTRRAVPARQPIGPDRLRDTLFGALAGLALGLLALLARALVDRTVRTRAHVEARGGHVLAEIPEDDTAAKLPLILSDPFSARAEGVRRLRTNLRGGSRTASGRPVTSVVVTSALPGEGRTTTACNLAIALAQNGDEVVLVDADLRRGALADVMGISAGTGLTNVLSGERPLAEALHTWRHELPLRVLPSGPLPPNPSEVAGSPQLAALIGTLTANGLTVVLDSPPLLPVTDAALLAAATDGAVVVVRSGTSTHEDLEACLDTLQAGGARSLGVVLNRADGRSLTLPPVATSPRRRRADVRHAKAAPATAPRTAPPDTIAGSVTSWYEPRADAPTSAPGQTPMPAPAAAPRQAPHPAHQGTHQFNQPVTHQVTHPSAHQFTHQVTHPSAHQATAQPPYPQPVQSLPPSVREALPHRFSAAPPDAEPLTVRAVPPLPRQAPTDGATSLAPLPSMSPAPDMPPAPAVPSMPPGPAAPSATSVPIYVPPTWPSSTDDSVAPPTAPISTPPQALSELLPDPSRPSSRREARRRLSAVPDDETHEMPRASVRPEVVTAKVDLRDVTPRVPTSGSTDPAAVWAPPWHSGTF